MKIPDILCPKCNKPILKNEDDGSTKIRAKIIIIRDGHTTGKCPYCKAYMDIPLILCDSLTTKLLRSIQKNGALVEKLLTK